MGSYCVESAVVEAERTGLIRVEQVPLSVCVCVCACVCVNEARMCVQRVGLRLQAECTRSFRFVLQYVSCIMLHGYGHWQLLKVC